MPRFVDELSDDDSDDSGGDSDQYQLIQWFPSDLPKQPERQQQENSDEWILNNPVVVTDVTVDDLTVTMVESQRPEGFFRTPVDSNWIIVYAYLHRKHTHGPMEGLRVCLYASWVDSDRSLGSIPFLAAFRFPWLSLVSMRCLKIMHQQRETWPLCLVSCSSLEFYA